MPSDATVPRTSNSSVRKAASRAEGGATAAAKAVERNITSLRLPWLGKVSLPPIDHLAWYGSVATLAAIELIEWPVAVLLAAGKVLADNRNHRTLRAFGEALEEVG